jgi:hypothetical protein
VQRRPILSFAAFGGKTLRENDLMKMRRMLPGILILLLLIAACAPPPPLRDDTMLIDDSLASSDPCAAPCWNGITPGETRWSEALIILQDDADLAEPTTRNPGDEIFPDAQVAEFSRNGGSTCCQLISLDGEVVSTIFLRLSPTVRIGQVIENHGQPEYVALSPYSEQEALVNLIYPAINTVVYAYVAGEATGELSADSELIGVLYITSEDMTELLTSSPLHAWEGYGSYASYNEGPYEVTPEPTVPPTPES